LSLASRFLFTAFSADGQAIWLMKVSPEGWTRFMRAKLVVFGLPILLFCLVLSLLSGKVMGLTANQIGLVGLHGLWDAALMVALALALGMIFIDPAIENPL